jgi:hypothetical protein
MNAVGMIDLSTYSHAICHGCMHFSNSLLHIHSIRMLGTIQMVSKGCLHVKGAAATAKGLSTWCSVAEVIFPLGAMFMPLRL